MADRTITVKPSGGDYTTLRGALAGEITAGHANLTTDNGSGGSGILNIEISGSWTGAPDTATASCTTAGYTTSSTCYLNIYTDSANRFNGKWDTGKYILQATSYYTALLIASDYVRVTGLQISITILNEALAVVGVGGQVATNNLVRISYCSVKGPGDAGATSNNNGIYISGGDANVDIWNTVIWNINTTNANSMGLYTNGAHVHVENCTIWGGEHAINNGGDNRAMAINVLAGGCVGEAFLDYAWLSGSGYNASDDATADNAGGNYVLNADVTFKDAANGDFHLESTDTDVIGVGTSSVTLGFTDDVDGVARGASWDIGAAEYVAAAGGGGVVVTSYQMYYDRMRRVQ